MGTTTSTSGGMSPVPPRPVPTGGAPDDGMGAMSALLARNWWAIALRGVFAILFGLAALFLPLATIQALVLLFAAYMLVDGAFAIIAAARAAARHERWGLLILEGIVDLVAGVLAFLWPGLTAVVFVLLLGVWSVFSGVLMAVAGFRLRGTHGRWWLVLAGVLSAVWGVLLYLSPVAGAIVLTWWLGGYALAFGALLLVLAFRLRGRRDTPTPAVGAAA